MQIEKPYFMMNDDWYYFDENDFMYKLTDIASDEVKESYEEFYNQLESVKEYENQQV